MRRALQQQVAEGDAAHGATRVALSTVRAQHAVLEGRMRDTQRSVEINELHAASLARQLGEVQGQIQEGKVGGKLGETGRKLAENVSGPHS